MASPNVADDLDRGRKIGKYEVLTRLSMGGMAELFLAFIPGPGGFRKFVAVKQILPDIKKDQSFVKMFLDEARISAAFSHNNIGQVYDLGEDQGELYLAMEFISGQNLEQVIKRCAKKGTAVPVGFACRVVRDACLGLHYAHHFTEPSGKSAPVVHRDVSPKNVMVTYSGDVKMIDFGIAKAKNRLNRTQVGIVKGTSGYMSPEQVRNEQLDGRTDLFVAAVILHELLTGQRLFTASTDAAMMMKIVEGEVQQPRNLNPEVPQALSDVVMKGLSRKRETRFATGKELAKAIDQAFPEIYDEEQVAAFMGELFADKIQTTQALLEMANTGDVDDLSRAVEKLSAEELESSPGRRKATGSRDQLTRAQPSATPPNPPPRRASKQNLRSVDRSPAKEEVDDTLPPPRSTARKTPSNRSLGKVARERKQVDEQAEANNAMASVVVFIALVAVLGGGGWAIWKGPLRDSAAGKWLDKEMNGEPLPSPPGTLEDAMAHAKGPKPQWLVDKEKHEAELQAERERQKAIEEAANSDENKSVLAELERQIKQLDDLEAEQHRLKEESRRGKAVGEANGKRIADLEKQISELRGMIDTNRLKTGSPRLRGGGVEVVRDQKSAVRNAVGTLTLRTIHPSSANVFDGDTYVGSTPLLKVPLEAGVHRLRVVDGDAKNRLLNVTIAAGKPTDLIAVDVTSLPLMQ